MAQWTNVNRNDRFVNPPPLPWLSEISGTIHLALPGLTAGRLAGWLTGRRNPGKFRDFENRLQIELFDFPLRLANKRHYYSSTNASKQVFRLKPIARLILRCEKSRSHTISYRSLLLIKCYRT